MRCIISFRARAASRDGVSRESLRIRIRNPSAIEANGINKLPVASNQPVELRMLIRRRGKLEKRNKKARRAATSFRGERVISGNNELRENMRERLREPADDSRGGILAVSVRAREGEGERSVRVLACPLRGKLQ